LSYSALTQYEQCPRAYYLGRVKQARSKATWFFPVGTVVHESIEHYLEHGEVPNFEEKFYPLVANQMLTEPDDTKWLAGGPVADPVIRAKAVQLGKDCVEAAVEYLQDFTVHHVELDVSGMLPGCEVLIKGFVDVLGEHKKHGLGIVDWKSSASKPKDNFQLETYRALTMKTHPQYTKGFFAMLRPSAAKARPIDLSGVDDAMIGARYQRAYEAIKAKLWQTKASYSCNWCFQAPNCLLQSGNTPRARYYDAATEEGYPF
jgi:putative RecB family exonuclease